MGKKNRRAAWAWADLPEDMVGDVLRRLPSFADRARFRAVCRAWRAAWRSQPHPPAPWLAVPGNCVSLPDGAIHRVWSLPEDARATRCCGSIGDWVALVPADRQPFLHNLFSEARIPLPPCAEEDVILKMVMSSTPGSESFLIAAICTVRGSDNQHRITACRPAEAWWEVSIPLHLHDIIFYQGKLHALHSCDQLVVLDQRKLDLLRREPERLHEQQLPPPVANIWDWEGYPSRRYLVVCKTKLLKVTSWFLRLNYRAVKFEVHALETSDGTAPTEAWWVPVKSISGHALFVGDACSEAFPVAAGHKIKESHVCFVEDELRISCARSPSAAVNGGHPLGRLHAYRLRDGCASIYNSGESSARKGQHASIDDPGESSAWSGQLRCDDIFGYVFSPGVQDQEYVMI